MGLGWFKLHRELFEKAIWIESTPEQKVILITLLGMANHQGKEWEWRGKQFKAIPGQFVTSNKSILERCGKGISQQNLRTALKKFEKYEFLTMETTKVNTLITVVNWGLYQGGEEETNKEINKHLTNDQQTPNKQVTNSQQTPNKRLTTNKNVKKDKNIKNDKEGEEGKENVTFPPTLSTHQILIKEQFGDVTYKTWFSTAEIVEDETRVNIKVPNEFNRTAIITKYKSSLENLFNKRIDIELG